MDYSSFFHPHKFHPQHYASDPYDFLLEIPQKEKPVFLRDCVDCGVQVERYSVQTENLNVRCFDCERKRRTEKERIRKAKLRGK